MSLDEDRLGVGDVVQEKPTDVQHANILPSSVPRESKNFKLHRGIPWVAIFCANCGRDGGWIPEAAKDFAFYLCVPCAEKWQPLADTYLVPDEVFWERVKQTQIEKYGRELTGEEVAEALKDENHVLTKLARDRPTFKKET